MPLIATFGSYAESIVVSTNANPGKSSVGGVALTATYVDRVPIACTEGARRRVGFRAAWSLVHAGADAKADGHQGSGPLLPTNVPVGPPLWTSGRLRSTTSASAGGRCVPEIPSVVHQDVKRPDFLPQAAARTEASSMTSIVMACAPIDSATSRPRSRSRAPR